ncbi:hypothetical protein [Archangium sp.]|uniref:hypothetical protein n=1 Tax=Archangium sp. TaxID=1872627 RepID=UPI00286C96DA|nr:hypothetical protein [Archangium sp.]
MPLHSERGGIGLEWQDREVGALAVVPVDARRSLAVTDKAILSRFSLRAVMDQLAAQSGVAGLTGDAIFRQLWDTQNTAPGVFGPGFPHCTDAGGTLNGFPYPCRQGPGSEGGQAAVGAPININSYSAIGLFNRFDLAPASGQDCGEHRIVFAKTDTTTPGRNFLIFEAVLPNPRADLGPQGCWPVADFWSNLTAEPNITLRGDKLKDFYFNGLVYKYADTGLATPFGPVLHIRNLGNNPGKHGQIRTNQFISPPWLLREFKLEQNCFGCTLVARPQTVKTNPSGDLFDPANPSATAANFRTHFRTQVAALAVNNLNLFNHDVPDVFNIGQSDSQTPGTRDNYVARFGPGPSAFHTAIQNELNLIGSPLTPRDIVARAQALSCGGCHQRSNGALLGGGLTWPSTVPSGFVHNSEFNDPLDPTRFELSPALLNVFIPHRKGVFENYLLTTAAP